MFQLPSMITSIIRSTMTREATYVPTVHKFTNDPNKAWEMISVKQTVKEAALPDLYAPINPRKVRFVCISDTHNRLPLKVDVPDGDVLLHTGDFSMIGKPEEIEVFNTWLGTLPHKYKIVIAGNHDLTFDSNIMKEEVETYGFGLDVAAVSAYLREKGVDHAKDLLTNCIYLEDSGTSVFGITIYGSPWQPEFCDWGFNLPRGQALLDKWNMIPEGINILMTHGPPIGYGDLCSGDRHAGCVELLDTVQNRVKCKYHVFGHVHEAYGAFTDGNITYINASTCTRNYRPVNNPIIFDFPLPEGVNKEDFLSMEATEKIKEATTKESEKIDQIKINTEEEDMDIAVGKVEEEIGSLVLTQNYDLEPTRAPPSSTSTDGAFKMS